MNSNPFIQCPNCIDSRKQLKAVLLDYFPEDRLNVNLLLAAYEIGIIELIDKADTLDFNLKYRIRKLMIENYGVSDSNADWAITYWFKNYGIKAQKKIYISEEELVAIENARVKLLRALKGCSEVKKNGALENQSDYIRYVVDKKKATIELRIYMTITDELREILKRKGWFYSSIKQCWLNSNEPRNIQFIKELIWKFG